MCSLLDVRFRCQIVLIDGCSGRQFRVERLPCTYSRGYRLTETGSRDEAPVFAHELPSGVQECNCPAWLEARACEHTALLIGAGLFDPPRWFGPADEFPEDELVAIDWESSAP